MSAERPYIAVVGAGEANAQERALAEQVGEELARAGAIVLTGGLGGVMQAACAGALSGGGLTVGILPSGDRAAANPHVTVAIATGLGELRNGLLVRAADALIAIGGAYGTLSEIALALRTGVPVVGLQSWQLEGMRDASTPQQAVAMALSAGAQLRAARGRRDG